MSKRSIALDTLYKRILRALCALIAAVVICAAILCLELVTDGKTSEGPKFENPTLQEEITARPGTSRIVLVGPKIKTKEFKIILDSSTIPIPISTFRNRGGEVVSTSVHIKIRVDTRGNSFITDFSGSGTFLAEARQAIRSWRFTPFKTGTIEYTINYQSASVPINYTTDLKPIAGDEFVDIRNGLLYYIH